MRYDLEQFGLTLLLLATALGGCRGNKSDVPPVHLNQNMDFQQKFEAQEPNDWFPNGRAMREPIEGTVSRSLEGAKFANYLGGRVPTVRLRNDGRTNHYFTGLNAQGNAAVAKHAVDQAGKKESERTPPQVKATDGLQGLPHYVRLNEGLLDRGKERFGVYCTPCHGLSGYGNGSVALKAGSKLTVPSYHGPTDAETRDARTYPLGYIYHVITHGSGRMESYARQIPGPDRWAIAA
jgi:hypothetical protein